MIFDEATGVVQVSPSTTSGGLNAFLLPKADCSPVGIVLMLGLVVSYYRTAWVGMLGYCFTSPPSTFADIGSAGAGRVNRS
jgi:hypothetical protein